MTLDSGSSSLVRKECKSDGTLICQPFVPLGAHAQKTRKRQSTSQFSKKVASYHKRYESIESYLVKSTYMEASFDGFLSFSQTKVSRHSQAHDLNYDFEQTSNKSTSTTGDLHPLRGNHVHAPFLANTSPNNNNFPNVEQQFANSQNYPTEDNNSTFNGENEDGGVSL